MGFLDSIKRGIRLVKLDGRAAIEIAKDANSWIYGLIIITAAGLIYSLAFYIRTIPFDAKNFLIDFGMYVLFTIIGILIFHGLAKLFGGKSRFNDYFKAQSHVSLLGWLSIFMAIDIPFMPNILDFLIMIWGTVIGITVLKSVHKLSTWKAIVVALMLPLLLVVLVVIGSLAYFGVLSPDKFLPMS